MAAPTALANLAPTGDPAPVEKAVVDGIAADHDPETFLYMMFRRPDGSCQVWYAWTDGGHRLGDRIDQVALAAGLDCADTFHITRRHFTKHERGRIQVEAHPLRPILADVRTGVRAPESERDAIRRLFRDAENPGQHAEAVKPLPRWLGVGPTLLNRPA
jgi:hypothetical protein